MSAAKVSYPRTLMPSRIYWDGTPFFHDGAWDDKLILAHADYDVVCFEIWPCCLHPERLWQMKNAHPEMKILGLTNVATYWARENPGLTAPNFGIDPNVTSPFGPQSEWYDWRLAQIVTSLDGVLYNVDGKERWGADSGWTFNNVNIAKQDGYGHFVVAIGLADLAATELLNGSAFDGIFCDWSLYDMTGIQLVDFKRAGYETVEAFVQGWKGGMLAYYQTLRYLLPRDFVITANTGGQEAPELVPYLNGAGHENIETAEYDKVMASYLADNGRFRAPLMGGFSMKPSGTVLTADDQRRFRFGFCSALMGEGLFGFSTDGVTSDRGYSSTWWDEYAVVGGISRDRGVPGWKPGRGWLGQPLGRNGSRWLDGTWHRTFENGRVIVNPNAGAIATMVGGAKYRRISGFVSTDVNNGQSVGTTLIIPPRDGLVLWRNQ